jgi:hypothetical protein
MKIAAAWIADRSSHAGFQQLRSAGKLGIPKDQGKRAFALSRNSNGSPQKTDYLLSIIKIENR